jgi:hypothetical protein
MLGTNMRMNSTSVRICAARTNIYGGSTDGGSNNA